MHIFGVGDFCIEGSLIKMYKIIEILERQGYDFTRELEDKVEGLKNNGYKSS